ncbi:hypothetical protein [Leifsonia sp. WHRI 6310E]|uniref:hypothetical protein n=1 Tax=Leifsonia sp. WHRI 6310E TaxID=3162562 RepID=UPI0032EC25AF
MTTNPHEALAWDQIAITTPPELFVGWRRYNKRLEARRLSLHQDTFEDLIAIANTVLSQLATMTAVEDGPYVSVEFGEEYLWLPRRNDEGDLISLASHVDDIVPIDASSYETQSLDFYGVSVGTTQGRITFVRKSSPRRALHRGNRFFRYSEVLRHAVEPDLMLEADADIVVCESGTAVLRPSAFQVLASDVSFAMEHVDDHVEQIAQALADRLPLTPAVVEVFKAAGRSKVSVAKRLKVLSENIGGYAINPTAIREKAIAHGLEVAEFFSDDGALVVDEFGIADLLDLLEGRLFTLDFQNKRARADRYRVR